MKVLFIGNSYTYYNDMPKMVGGLMRENGIDGEVFSVTRGARKLFQNVDDQDEATGELDALMASVDAFDAMILQEQSLLPLLDAEKFRYGVTALIQKLGAQAKRVILYATWGRKSGSPQLETCGWSSAEMTEGLARAYRELGESLGVEVSYVGLAFARLYPSCESVELYSPDCSHSSVTGSALAALVHYQKLMGKLPEKTDSLGLNQDTVAKLLEAATAVK